MAEKYKSKHGRASAGSVALKIIIPILIVALLGAGAFAAWNYIIKPAQDTEPTMESVPTIQPETATFETAPTHAPTEPPEPDYAAFASSYLNRMSLEDKICQMMIVSTKELTGVDGATEAGDTTKEKLGAYNVGGIVYFSDNIEDEQQLASLIKGTSSFASTPLFIAVDEEGGSIARVANAFNGFDKLNAMYTYKAEGTDTAKKNAVALAENIASYGFNLNFAPVADVWSIPENVSIGDRAYSDDYDEAATLVAAAVTGFEEGGVMTTLKHFPGQGTAIEDTELIPAHVDKSRDQLIAEELVPFKAGIDAGADMVMVGHIVVSALDDTLPATLSPKVVPDLLRGELGYDGVVISDSLEMGALDDYSTEQIVKGIFSADIDMFLMPDDIDDYIDTVETLIDSGDISEDDVNAKVLRVLTLKYRKGLLTIPSQGITEATEATEAAQTSAAN